MFLEKSAPMAHAHLHNFNCDLSFICLLVLRERDNEANGLGFGVE
jgi:hypothetical protein